jgi:hypothetical protein
MSVKFSMSALWVHAVRWTDMPDLECLPSGVRSFTVLSSKHVSSAAFGYIRRLHVALRNA